MGAHQSHSQDIRQIEVGQGPDEEHGHVSLGGIHISIGGNSNDEQKSGFHSYAVERLLDKVLDAAAEPQTDAGKLEKLKLQFRERELRYQRQDENRNSLLETLAAVRPFLTGWKRDLVCDVLDSNAAVPSMSEYASVSRFFTEEYTYPSADEKNVLGRIKAFQDFLGICRPEDFQHVDIKEVLQLLRPCNKKTTWENLEQMDDDAASNFADFHQVMDGVKQGSITNCLLAVEERPGTPAYSITVNAPGCPIHLDIRFVGSNVYVDYHGYIKRVASYETATKGQIPRMHLAGPWLARKESGLDTGFLHGIRSVEVAGPRSVTKVASELCNSQSPSTSTLKSWRREFAIILSTSDLWFSWRKVSTKCEILRCKGGRMVVCTAVLTFNRNLGATLSRDAGLEAAQEEILSDIPDREITFDELTAILGAKVVETKVGSIPDYQVARAIYIASSWFSTVGPKGMPRKDCAWGNREIETTSPELVDWIPNTLEIKMAGWQLEPRVITPTGRDWGPLKKEIEKTNNALGSDTVVGHLAHQDSIGPCDPADIENCIWAYNK